MLLILIAVIYINIGIFVAAYLHCDDDAMIITLTNIFLWPVLVIIILSLKGVDLLCYLVEYIARRM
jgi:hypothetical protein